MALEGIQKFSVAALNQSGANPSWSNKLGNPLITFEIGSSELYLLPNLRVNFTLEIFNGAGNRPNNNQPDNAANIPVQEATTNTRLGAASVIETVTISNLNNNVLENCRNYPKLLASTVPASSGWGDYSTYLTQWFGATANDTATGKMTRRPISVSMPILTGLFAQNQPLPLSYENGTGGLRITLALSPSVQALISTQAAPDVGAYYVIRNVSLDGTYGVPAGGVLPKIDQLRFSAYQSFYNVISNSDVTTQINNNLGAVSSTFSNFVPSSWLNNIQQDSLATTALLNQSNPTNVAPIVGINYLKGGVKYPLQYEINSQALLKSDGGAGQQYRNSGFDSLRAWNFQNSVRPLTRPLDTLAGGRSEGLRVGLWGVGLGEQTGISPLIGLQQNQNTIKDRVFGIGVRYDALQNGSTTNFKGMPMSVRITSKLDGTPESSMSMYTFFLHRGVMTYNENGSVSVNT
jgi:hypothetical protein